MSLRAKEELRRGEDPEKLTAMIGTPGVGEGSFVGTCIECVPEPLHPLAEILWSAGKDAERPAPTRIYLRDRC
jgi:hypothetical protein